MLLKPHPPTRIISVFPPPGFGAVVVAQIICIGLLGWLHGLALVGGTWYVIVGVYVVLAFFGGLGTVWDGKAM